MNHAKSNPALLKYLPEEKDWVHIDKSWLCNVLYTIDTDNIEKMIKKAMQERRERLDKKEEQVIQIRPEFSQALQECVTFSSIHLYFTPSRGKR